MTRKKKIEKAFLKTKADFTPEQMEQLQIVKEILKKKEDAVPLSFSERNILNIFNKRKIYGKIISKIQLINKERTTQTS